MTETETARMITSPPPPAPAPRPPLLRGRTGLVAALRGRLRRLLGQVPHDPQVTSLLRQLQTLGFTEAPLADLARLARTARDPFTRTSAAIELAKWFIRPSPLQDHHLALDWIAQARGTVRLVPQRRHLVVLELLCRRALGAAAQGRKLHEAALEAGLWTPDLALAGAMVAPGMTERIAGINAALAHFDIAPVGLSDGAGLPPYDRLTCTAPPPPSPSDGPLVSVILAAYEAGDTLRTALRALQAQSWQKLEILVVDDASPSGSTARIVGPLAAADPRIRLIGMAVNGGAYVARNRALDLAQGDYVTLHDADDWSHPAKIATQLAHLQAHPAVLGCTSQQARATDDLDFLRWTGDGRAIMANYSSFMFRRAPMRAQFGYWDTVRMSADNELIRRMQARLGRRAVAFLETGPLSFQRDAGGTMTSDPVLGINGFRYGARQDYMEALDLWHRQGLGQKRGQKRGQDRGKDADAPLRHGGDPGLRPFPAPGLMQPDRARIAAGENGFDAILAGDFRPGSPGGTAALADVTALQAAGLRVGVFALFRYLGPSRRLLPIQMDERIRLALWAQGVRILCHGERAQCRELLIHDPACIAHPQRYHPEIRAATVRLVGAEGDPALPAALARLQADFGAVPVCHPDSATARQAILQEDAPAGGQAGGA